MTTLSFLTHRWLLPKIITVYTSATPSRMPLQAGAAAGPETNGSHLGLLQRLALAIKRYLETLHYRAPHGKVKVRLDLNHSLDEQLSLPVSAPLTPLWIFL